MLNGDKTLGSINNRTNIICIFVLLAVLFFTGCTQQSEPKISKEKAGEIVKTMLETVPPESEGKIKQDAKIKDTVFIKTENGTYWNVSAFVVTSFPEYDMQIPNDWFVLVNTESGKIEKVSSS